MKLINIVSLIKTHLVSLFPEMHTLSSHHSRPYFSIFTKNAPISELTLQKIPIKKGVTISSCSRNFSYSIIWIVPILTRIHQMLLVSDIVAGLYRISQSAIAIIIAP